MKKKIKLPKFKNEDEERDYWAKFDLSSFSPSDFQSVSFPNLKPTSQPISLRLPSHLITQVGESELWKKIKKMEKKFNSNFEQIFTVLKQIIDLRRKPKDCKVKIFTDGRESE